MGRKRTGRGKSDGSHIPSSVINKRSRRNVERKNKPRHGIWHSQLPEAQAANRNRLEAIASVPRSKLLDLLLPERREIYIPRKDCMRVRQSVDLSNFSFLDNPVRTLNTLTDIVRMNAVTGENRINFCDPMCYDMAPYMVLLLVAKEMERERLIGGTITPFIRKIFDETDFTENFKMVPRKEGQTDWEVWPIKVESCRQSTADAFQGLVAPHSKLADNFTGCIEMWLKQMDFGLTPTGLRHIMGMTGEVLNNAILHSGEGIGGEAWISGFMIPYSDGEGFKNCACYISILNLGKSIYESMQGCAPAVREDIESLVRKHKPMFSLRNYWNPEALWTLYALQDGVTGMYGNNIPRGGKGLMDMISFFSDIGQPGQSKLAIISGNVILKINDPVPTMGADGMRRLALNDTNSLEMPPKREYLKTLRQPFPGTILTWRFNLNPKHLQRMVGS